MGIVDKLNPMNYDSYWDKAWNATKGAFSSLEDSSFNQAIYDEIGKTKDAYNRFNDYMPAPFNYLEDYTPSFGDAFDFGALGQGFNYLATGDTNPIDPSATFEEGLRGLDFEPLGIANPYVPLNQSVSPTTLRKYGRSLGEGFEGVQAFDANYLDGEDESSGTGMGALYASQRQEAARKAAAAKDFVNQSYDASVEDFKLYQQQQEGTRTRNQKRSFDRLNESLSATGINIQNAGKKLTSLGIDAAETALKVGGQAGSALYFVYNMGAQLSDNLAALAEDTLATAKNSLDQSLSQAMYQIEEGLNTTLYRIDQAVIQGQIEASQAAALLKQKETEARAAAQKKLDLATILASRSEGQLQDPLAIYAAMEAGLDVEEFIKAPKEEAPEATFQGYNLEDLGDIMGLINPSGKPMTPEDLVEFTNFLKASQE